MGAASHTGSVRKWPLVAPAAASLLLWMIVPLVMTVWFSLQRYQLLTPQNRGWAGLENYRYLLTDPSLWTAMGNTLVFLGAVLVITVGAGLVMALLFAQEFPGRPLARLLVIAPFFVMPTVSALIWKNMLMHPVNGLFAAILDVFGLEAIDWFGEWPLLSIIVIVSWQWIPFALLVFLTALQSIDPNQKEAAWLDGAGNLATFRYITLPHLSRAISMVVMVEMIFLLSIFAEIFVTTGGGPGLASTNLAFLIYMRALLDFDVGLASAGGIVAIVLANIVAIFLIKTVARSLDTP